MKTLLSWLIYAIPAVWAVVLYLRRFRQRNREHQEALKASIEQGLMEPPSLHPIIDSTRCIGSSSCVKACPEDALGIINNKAELINAAHCIGHGACLPACPVDAIKLVFGTEKRGIDIPQVNPNFESNVPGIYIAGELGAIQYKLKYKLIEQEESLGGAVFHYPRNKIAMTAPVKLPIIGKVKMTEISKEKLLDFWNAVVKKTGLQISFRERMEEIQRIEGGFTVKTQR